MKRFKVRYGSAIQTIDLPDATTIGDLKRNDRLRADLGYGDNVNALYNGVALPDSSLAPEYIEGGYGASAYAGAIVMETACNKKES